MSAKHECLRIIINTNIFISLLISASDRSKIKDLVRLAFSKHTVLMSKSTFNELKATLNKSKIKKYIKSDLVEQFLKKVEALCEQVTVSSSVTLCRDQDDDKFLALAHDGKADIIITGDKDLLELKSFENTKILTANEAKEYL